MKIFLLVISAFWFAAGLVFTLFPKKSKTFYTNIVKPVKALFIIPLACGFLFMWAAPASRLEVFIRVLGIIAFIKGLFILIAPENMVKTTFYAFMNRSDKFWRFYGIFIMLLGIVTCWSVA